MTPSVGESFGAVIFGAILGLFAGLTAGVFLLEHETGALRREAVKVGAAYWVVHPDGSTTFTWSSTAARAEAP